MYGKEQEIDLIGGNCLSLSPVEIVLLDGKCLSPVEIDLALEEYWEIVLVQWKTDLKMS